MLVGDVVGGRFELEMLAGKGGMGGVFRARDLATGDRVAVKALLQGHEAQVPRFLREATVLEGLRHPGIVRYVTRDVTPAGEPYLVMEWLDGEDLGSRLRRGRLAVEDVVSLGVRAAEAMAAAHEIGIVHRDLKPTNVFLVDGDPGRVKLLDFGVAKLGDEMHLTQTGTAVGTPGYMAPEQAGGAQALSPAADVFSLGCVLFEAVAGTPPFVGDHMMAVLAKILFGEAPRLSEFRPDVPRWLEAVIAAMLAKDPDHRPRDGKAVAEALAARPGGAPTRPSLIAPIPALTAGERRLLSVVLLDREPPAEGGVAQTLPAANTTLGALRRVAEAHGARAECLADGAIVVAIAGTHVATDQAAIAARCALALRAEAPGRRMALATGRGEGPGKPVVGEAIDRAVSTLSKRFADGHVYNKDSGWPIALDEITAGLLDGRFDVREGDAGLTLHGEREVTTGTRRLLGKPTSCVGRDRELATLEGLFADCVQDSAAQAVLVTAPAGLGKSRLLHELLRVLQERHAGAAVWACRGDPLRAGSSLALLGQALRHACGVVDGEPLEQRRAKLRARVAEIVPAADRGRVAEFLGEIVGAPFPDGASPPLRAARQQASMMSEQMRRAWEDFLDAALSVHPILLVIEDLHWGDQPTVRFVDASLRRFKDRPWMVLALSRPEVHEVFPQLWTERGRHEIHLKELTRKASERLVQQVLGDAVSPETLERLVAQADGIPFYLEELIRAQVERKDEALPETVVAMVHARLEGLGDAERRVLRAASVFGETFWAGAVAALVGGLLGLAGPDGILGKLVERELLVRRPESRFPGEEELSFRHALLREGAYAMLTEADRVLGHELAADWLEQHGEDDPMVLAEHSDRGGDPARAGLFYARAAEQAARAVDMGTVIARAERALACGVPGAEKIKLLGVLSNAHSWRNDWHESARYAEEVLRLAEPGSTAWSKVAAAKVGGLLAKGDIDEVVALMEVMTRVQPAPEAVGHVTNAFSFGSFVLLSWCRFDLARAILQRAHAVVEPVAPRDPLARAWVHLIHVYLEPWANEDPWAGLQHAELARSCFEEADHQQGILLAQSAAGMNLWSLGAFDRAAPLLVSEHASMGALRTVFWVGSIQDPAALAEAKAIVGERVLGWKARRSTMEEGLGRWALSDVLRRTGDLDAAEREVRAALDLLAILPVKHLAATATLAAILLAQGRAAPALAAAEDAMRRYEATRAFGFRGAFASLVHAEALAATGEHEKAANARSAARARVLAQAEKIGDPAHRKSFLTAVPENARILASSPG